MGTVTITKHFYAGGLQVAKMVGSGVYYLHQDALGSTRLETTASVTIKFSSNYVPYGPNYAVSGKEVFMYTDKPYDLPTGLYYFGARFYDPTVGRFVTQDSYNGSKYSPLSQNRYIYAMDNPMKYVDPNGHESASSKSVEDWFLQFFGSHILDFVNLALDVIFVAEPALVLFRSSLATAAFQVLWGLFVGGGKGLADLANAVQSGDSLSSIGQIWGFEASILSTFLNEIPWWDRIGVFGLGAAFEGASLLTGESLREFSDEVAAGALGIDVSNLLFGAASSWDVYAYGY
jgi:RHS repeat-associated protein